MGEKFKGKRPHVDEQKRCNCEIGREMKQEKTRRKGGVGGLKTTFPTGAFGKAML